MTVRRLAAQVGTSTMAVYTHFGSMDELRREVRREGFERLARHLAAVRATADPLSDLAALGWAYCLNALRNPDLYRAMFMETTVDTAEAASNVATFLPTVTAVERCIQSGRLSVSDPWDGAVELWALAHGLVSLALSGMLSDEDLRRHLQNGSRACFVGYGDQPEATNRSLRRARRRMKPSDGWPTLELRRPTLAVAAKDTATPHQEG